MWQPEEESLKRLVDLLNESQVPDTNKQREIYQNITELASNPEFFNYLVYILSISDNPQINLLRRIAGATLKGVLERNFDKNSANNVDFIKFKLMEAFNDPSSSIRNTVTNVITALLSKIGFQEWPELMKFLILNLGTDQEEYLQSSLECIFKILEDIKIGSENFNYQDEKYQSFVNELIPKLLFLCNPKLPTKVKLLSISSLNLFVFTMPQSLANNFPVYYDMLIVSTQDQVPDVRQRSCEGLLEVLETKRDMIGQNLARTLERLVQLMEDNQPNVKRVACRYWNEYLGMRGDDLAERLEFLKNYLAALIPLLINCLIYTEDDQLNEDEERREGVKGRKDSFSNGIGDGVDGGLSNLDSGEKDDYQGSWTVRREAGRALGKLAEGYGDEIFLRSQEMIANSLRNSNWQAKEAGILCLGALAKGSSRSITGYFGELFPFLMASLDDQHSLIRRASIWTLSKYTGWVVEQGKIDPSILKTYLVKILEKMIDEDGKIQEASCTALCQIVYTYPSFVAQFIYDVMEVIKHVADHYQKKSLSNLYDVIASLADAVSPEKFADPQLQAVILGILKKKWESLSFSDRESIYLIECTFTVIEALGKQAAGLADFFIPKLLDLIIYYVNAKRAEERKHIYNKKEIAVRCFDLLGAFLPSVGVHLDKFIDADQFFAIYEECVQDAELTVKKVAIASAGDVARFCPALIKGRVEKVAQHLTDSLVFVNEEFDAGRLIDSCCNNSAWAIGEMALAFPNELMNYIPQLANKLCEILCLEELQKNKPLARNISVTLGRFGLVNPDGIAPLLERFLKPFCMALAEVRDDLEKQQAFRGLFLVISKNPNGIVQDFMFLCDALVRFENPQNDLQELASKLIVNFKLVAGQFWDSYFVKFPQELQEKMRLKFGV